MATGQGCAAIVAGQNVLPLTGEDAFLLTIDLETGTTEDLAELLKYDYDSRTCYHRMEQAYNVSLDAFYAEVQRTNLEMNLLRSVLTDQPEKRSPAIAIAVALGFTNTIVTASHFGYTLYEFNKLKDRITTLELLSDEILLNQNVFEERANFLFYENTFLGLNNKIIYDHFGLIKSVHLCDALMVAYDIRLRDLHTKLNNILRAIDKNVLTRDLMDHALLSETTAHKSFRHTIYAYSPTELYKRAKVFMRSVQNRKINLLVVYPVIEVQAKFNLVELIDTDDRLIFANVYGSKLLLPLEYAFNTLSAHTQALRHAEHCTAAPDFTTCQVGPPVSTEYQKCLISLYTNDTPLHCYENQQDAALKQSTNDFGTLLRSADGAILTDLANDKVILKSKEPVCTFIPNNRPIHVHTPKTMFILDKTSKNVGQKLPNIVDKAVMKQIIDEVLELHNFSIPTNANPFSYNSTNAKPLDPYLSFLKANFVYCSISICALCTLIVFCILIPCLCRRRRDENGNVVIYGPNRA